MSVYFATAGGYMKIGFAADPISRVTTVTRNGKRPADLPFAADVELIGWVPGDRQAETDMHARFADRRVDGEWFRIDADVVRELIWSDPRGVDLDRMSMFAVLTCRARPDLTRDEIAACGVQVEATVGQSLQDAINQLLPSTA